MIITLTTSGLILVKMMKLEEIFTKIIEEV